MNDLKWKKYHPLSDKNAFICLVNIMGDDQFITQAARSSFNGFSEGVLITDKVKEKFKANPEIHSINKQDDDWYDVLFIDGSREAVLQAHSSFKPTREMFEAQLVNDRLLVRRLMNDQHTSPFEMVELVFMVQVPMDCWRQWIRHRTANVNEYSTRYMEALDFFQVTQPTEWRLQATDNKQGSAGYLKEWPEGTKAYIHKTRGSLILDGMEFSKAEFDVHPFTTKPSPGEVLSWMEEECNIQQNKMYQTRLSLGIAKEQARKDLPLSTYTRAYWKCDLHNIFNFLRLRMDSHAQLEIRSFANCMFEIVKQLCPVACEAFEDYVLHAKRFSRMEMEVIKDLFVRYTDNVPDFSKYDKPPSMTDREWKEFVEKLR